MIKKHKKGKIKLNKNQTINKNGNFVKIKLTPDNHAVFRIKPNNKIIYNRVTSIRDPKMILRNKIIKNRDEKHKLFNYNINKENEIRHKVWKSQEAIGNIGLYSALGFGAYKYYKYRKEKNVSKISKAIAALRKQYKNILLKAKLDPRNSSKFKKIGIKILKIIDTLMKRLQEITK